MGSNGCTPLDTFFARFDLLDAARPSWCVVRDSLASIWRLRCMHVLLVEDEDRDAEDAIAIINYIGPAIDVTHVRSRDSAFAAITANAEFDLIICDIRIPPLDGGLDADEQHGIAVHTRAR